MFKERCIQLTCLEEMLNRDVYLICHNSNSGQAMIDGTMIDVLRRVVRFSKQRKKAAVIIQTPGGSLDGTIYICNFFREYYSGVDTYIAGDCFSGGTIIALSSDNIYMNRNACLGPIDIQLYRDKENPWDEDLYGMVNALERAFSEKKVSKDMQKSFEGEEDVLAEYFKLKYTYKDLIGEYVKRHCVDGFDWERIWSYMAELNLSHGSPLTYKKCRDIGLDVKKMPVKVDKIVSKVLRDVEDEFGGLMRKHLLYDFYDMHAGEEIKKPASTGKDNFVEMRTSRHLEKLGVIETSQSSYIQEVERIITIQDFLPVGVVTVKSGWKEEYNTNLVVPELNNIFEDFIDETTCYSFGAAGIDVNIISKSSYMNVRNFIKVNYYENTIEVLKEEGVDIDALSSAEKWKAVVEYFLDEQEERNREVTEKLNAIWQEAASERGLDFSALSSEEKEDFYVEVINSKANDVIKWLGVEEKEFMSLPKDERYELVIQYFLEIGKIE